MITERISVHICPKCGKVKAHQNWLAYDGAVKKSLKENADKWIQVSTICPNCKKGD